MVGFCPSCFTFISFSSVLISFPELDFDDDDEEEVFADLKLLLCSPNDCGLPMCDVVGDCDVRSSFDDKFVGVPPADDRL
jgi:hypothetical protein